MTVTSPRVFIVDFDLVGYSGHFFNQVFGLREAARARGIEAKIYVAQRADPAIAEELGAHAILPFVPWLASDKEVTLEGFPDAQQALRPLWNDLDAADISEHDVLLITSSRPQFVFGVGQWLRGRPAAARPAVVFRFFAPEFYDFEAKTFKEGAWAYRFASRSLIGMPGAERIFFTLNDRKALGHLERLGWRRAFYLPVPKYYDALAELPEARAIRPLTIYVHINLRSGQISGRINDLLNKVLSRYSDVRFFVRFCKDSSGEDDLRREIDKSFVGHSVEFLPAEQNHVEYLATIERSDVVLLPYDPVKYRGIVSGIFCEAVAMGKIAVVPAGTWMADHVTEGRAAGVLFGENSTKDMVDAIDRVMQDRERLQAEARRNAPSFREENSCARNFDEMLELAGQSHDMRLSYVPLADTTKALGSQHYFSEGWCLVDEGFGIWSDGDRAQIDFSIRPSAKALFFSAQVRPFLARSHSHLEVSLTANNQPVAEWSFDAARLEDLDWSWRHVQIPEVLAASGEIRIVLSIRSPASPKELGLSQDPRKLGVALRRLSLGPELFDLDSSEPVSKRLRLKPRLKRLLKWFRWNLKPSSPSSK